MARVAMALGLLPRSVCECCLRRILSSVDPGILRVRRPAFICTVYPLFAGMSGGTYAADAARAAPRTARTGRRGR